MNNDANAVDVYAQKIYEEAKALGLPFSQYALGYIQAEALGFLDQQ